jgi:hypothetical protein
MVFHLRLQNGKFSLFMIIPEYIDIVAGPQYVPGRVEDRGAVCV